MAQEDGNGSALIRLKTIQQLNEKGCTFGNINREKIDSLEERFKSIDVKLWILLGGVGGKLAYDILTTTPIAKAFGL